jgi:hypothetical protein
VLMSGCLHTCIITYETISNLSAISKTVPLNTVPGTVYRAFARGVLRIRKDPHQIGRPDQDPRQSEKLNLDPLTTEAYRLEKGTGSGLASQ